MFWQRFAPEHFAAEVKVRWTKKINFVIQSQDFKFRHFGEISFQTGTTALVFSARNSNILVDSQRLLSFPENSFSLRI